MNVRVCTYARTCVYICTRESAQDGTYSTIGYTCYQTYATIECYAFTCYKSFREIPTRAKKSKYCPMDYCIDVGFLTADHFLEFLVWAGPDMTVHII